MCFCGCLYVHHMLICTQDGQKRASESLDLELHTCSWALQFWCQELQSFAGTAMTLTTESSLKLPRDNIFKCHVNNDSFLLIPSHQMHLKHGSQTKKLVSFQILDPISRFGHCS